MWTRALGATASRLASRRLAAAAGAASATALSLALSSERLADPSKPSRCESSLLQQAVSSKPLLFAWGRLAPASGHADAAPVLMRTREPLDVGYFFSSRGLRVVDLAYGQTHAAALDDQGCLWAWGETAGAIPRKLPCGRHRVSKVVSTHSGLYALTSRGYVLEWRDLDERLAVAADGNVPAPSPLAGALARMNVTSLAAGDAHVLAVGKDGVVVAMGDNSHGQLGLGEPNVVGTKVDEPTTLTTLPAGAKPVGAACGGAHSLLLLEDGGVLAFGDDRNLQLGLRARTVKAMRDGRTQVPMPERVILLPRERRVVGVAAGGGGIEGGHSVFVLRGSESGGDELWVCGHGRWGQLGTRAFTHQTEVKEVTALSKLRQWDEQAARVVGITVEKIACGEKHTAALLSTGNLFVWGWNDHGQLGSGGGQGSHTPAMIKSPTELRFAVMRGLACGPNSTAVWS